MIRDIEMYIFIFFIYSFAGWCMESIGGIFNPKVKKFINRGFMIGPYCPVYGIGIVLVNLLLKKYSNDIPALFFLAILICGTLEYFTGYMMEKLFNARWWDYSKKKFNINGRICLDTLLPFGIVATIIICKINPFLFSIFENIPSTIFHVVSIVLILLFMIDFIISFNIILSLKGEIKNKKDNTEQIVGLVKDKTDELSEKVKEGAEELGEFVKDKAEDVIMKAESDFRYYGRKYKLKIQRKTRYTRKKLEEKVPGLLELAQKINDRREKIEKIIEEEKQKIKIKHLEYELKQKEKKQIINEKINNLKITSEEFNKQIIEKFKNKSILTERLVDAFPSLQIKRNEKKPKKK